MSTDTLIAPDSLTHILTDESPACIIDECDNAAEWACNWHNCPQAPVRPATYCDKCWTMFTRIERGPVKCGHCHRPFDSKKQLVGNVWRI